MLTFSELKQQIQTRYQQLPDWVMSKYFISAFVFTLWMAFFDSHNWWSQWRLQQQIQAVQQEISHYKTKTTEVSQTEKIFSNPATLEKFARETYFMKKSNEEVFVIVKE